MFTNSHTHYLIDREREIYQASFLSNVTCWHSVGIHPWNANLSTLNLDLVSLRQSINDYTVAIGECGIDGFHGAEIQDQLLVFREQIKLSEELELPLIIHCVKGWNEVQHLKKELKPKQKWIYHGFLKEGIVHQVVAAGLMISLGEGIIYYPKAEKLISAIPDDQLLLETDDKEIEIKEVYEFVAKVKSLSLRQLNEIVTTNFRNTYTKWQIG